MGMVKDTGKYFKISSTFSKSPKIKELRRIEPKDWIKIEWLYLRLCAEVAEVNNSTGIIPSLGTISRPTRFETLMKYFDFSEELLKRSLELLMKCDFIKIERNNYVISHWAEHQIKNKRKKVDYGNE